MTCIVKRSFPAIALFLAAGLILSVGCTRPEEEIGLQLQPDDDILQADRVDTFTVRAVTTLDDSIRTDKINPAVIGAYRDPVFGVTRSGHVTELRLSSINPQFIAEGSTMDDMVIDSMVLVLSYFVPEKLNETRPYYGNGLGEQYFQVFEVSDSLYIDSAYFDYSAVNYYPEDLVKPGYNLQKPAPFTNVYLSGDTIPYAPQLRIPLKEELGYRFLEASADGEFTAPEFISMFRGIYVKVDETKADLSKTSLFYFDTFNSDSRIMMYYHDTHTGEDSLRYSFVIRNNSGKFNKPYHNYASAHQSLKDQLSREGGTGDQDLYVQGMAGLKINVDFPYLNTLKDSTNVAVNKAELVLPVRLMHSLSVFNPPAQLFIFGRNTDGTLYQLSDDDANGRSGLYDPASQSYRFVISRYIQQILLGNRENTGVEIVPIAAGRNANRAIINGPEYPSPDNPSNNLKLELTFTKF